METIKLAIKALRRTPILEWFDKSWWEYLTEKADDPGYTSKINRFWCRAAGHPAGVWFYNCGGSKPDYSCKNCGDDIE